MTRTAIGLTSLLALAPGRAFATEASGDFRLPFSPGKRIAASTISPAESRFLARNGRDWAVYHDDALGTVAMVRWSGGRGAT